MLPLQDANSAVRLADPRQLPLPADVIDFHRAAPVSRMRRDGADIPALLEKNLSVTARGPSTLGRSAERIHHPLKHPQQRRDRDHR